MLTDVCEKKKKNWFNLYGKEHNYLQVLDIRAIMKTDFSLCDINDIDKTDRLWNIPFSHIG